jgi:hypothetical protein
LLSAELGLCTLGYLAAHALTVGRAPLRRRLLALSPYAVITVAYLAHYFTAGYGVAGNQLGYRDVFAAPGAALLGWLEALPVWLATTATAPVASLQLILPNARTPILLFSVAILALLLPLVAARWSELPAGTMWAAGAVLSLVPLATVLPQDRLRFFVALGVYGVLGPWVASNFDAQGRLRRVMARLVWRIHGVWLPLFFVPGLFGMSAGFASGGAEALDKVIPRATSPITILVNAPSWTAASFQAAKRTYHGEPRPPVFTLYSGTDALAIERVDARTLELEAPHGWLATPFERLRDLTRFPFRVGERIPLAHLSVEIREVDARGAPTRARFTFDRPLDDHSLEFYYWHGSKLATWKLPPIATRVQLPAATVL